MKRRAPMEKKNKMYSGTATSFGFKKPVPAPLPKPRVPATNPAPPPNNVLAESVETLVITAPSGTSRLARPKKDSNGTAVRTNRFGFRSPTALSNKVADSQNHVNSTNTNVQGLVRQTATEVSSRLPQPKSHLPRPQFPVRLATAAHYHPRTASADKSAKTAANNNTARRSRSANGGSSASSVNGSDSGVGSQKSGGDLEMIEQLECSPSTRRLRIPQKSRPMEMKFPVGKEKKFELRDLSDSIEVTEIMPLELPTLPSLAKRLPQTGTLVRDRVKAYTRQISRENNSASSEDDEGIEDEAGEEKVHRDRVLSEKDEKGVVGAGEEAAEGEDLWGHGEAMVMAEEIPRSHDLDLDSGCRPMSPPLRSMLLCVEDHTFAALAAMSTTAMLEDESYPELPDFQTSLSLTSTSAVTSPKSLPPPSEKKNSDDSPGSPGTPTHTSNSFSLSSEIRGDRDFIDDEICDQPGLVYNNVTANSSGNTIIADDASPKVNKHLSAVAQLTVDCHSARHSSVGTLSPCESIASDDLIMDFDLSAVDDDHRLETSSLEVPLTDGELEEGEQLSTLISSRPELMNGVRATRQLRPRVGSSGSGADSPRSLDTPRLRSALASPLRSRHGTSTPGDDVSEDSGIRVNRDTYESMCQDVISIKAALFKLSRVLQERDAENEYMKQQNGHIDSSVDKADVKSECGQRELVTDLQRQVVFLRSQLEERDRTIRRLQSQLEHTERLMRSQQETELPEPRTVVETCTATTQTDRVRPLSGPILSTQPDAAGGSFVSNTSDSGRPQPTPRPVSRLPQWRRAPSPSCESHKSIPSKKT